MDKGIAMSGIAAILIIAVLTSFTGCSVDDLVTLDPPAKVRELVLDPEKRYTIADSEEVWESWNHLVKLQTDKLARETERAQESAALLASVLDTSVGFVQDNAALFPGGAIIAGLAGMAAGVFVPKPGTKKKLDAAKHEAMEDSAEKLTNVLKVLAEKNKAKK